MSRDRHGWARVSTVDGRALSSRSQDYMVATSGTCDHLRALPPFTIDPTLATLLERQTDHMNILSPRLATFPSPLLAEMFGSRLRPEAFSGHPFFLLI